MLFYGKNKLLPAIFASMLFLSGCGSKQTDMPQFEPAPLPGPSAGAESLTSSEISALHSTGQIDKNIPREAMGDIAAQYRYFLRKGRDTMCSFSKRSERYLAYARKVFRSRGMPEELANLAIIESGYRPDALSRAGAAGAWQFMPQTGAHYGLVQDWWLDERLDPYKATEAAADYLQKLYNDFGDWPTAIAAYNAGEGKISRAKAGTGGKDFYEVNSLNHTLDEKTQLRDETRQYVPRFIAVTKIMRNLPKLGFEPIDPESSPEVLRLKARPGTDLRDFSRACNLNWNEFSRMNQHHKRAITCTDRETFVYVPADVKDQAQKYMCTMQPASFAGWKPVKVASSKDSLEKISKRTQVPLARLQSANPGISNLKAGQIILAPLTIRMAKADISQPAKSLAQVANIKSGSVHQLKSGETLYAIARKYGLSAEELRRHNNIVDTGRLRAGHVLSIPKKAGSQPASAGASGSLGKRKGTYTVQAKDNLWSIARRHKISVEDLKRWNNATIASLKPGQELIVAQE